MWLPGLTFCGSAIQPPRFPLVFGRVPAAIVRRLPKCVRSGATCPAAVVPRMAWQRTQALFEKHLLPALLSSGRLARRPAAIDAASTR